MSSAEFKRLNRNRQMPIDNRSKRSPGLQSRMRSGSKVRGVEFREVDES